MAEQELPMLVLYEGQPAGQRWLVDQDQTTIGREPDCEVVIEERQVSRYHARIERDENGYTIIDLGSKNGTYVNGEEVRGDPRRLKDGDEIQIALCVRLGFVGAHATLPLQPVAPGRGITLERGARRAFVAGQEVEPPLSVAQFRLLELLLDRQGEAVSRDEVVEVVWPEEAAQGISEQAIDALVRRLRERLTALDPHHNYILTIRGHGFRLDNR
jgi:predicted component of type VI protein secretion system